MSVDLPSLGACALVWWCAVSSGVSSSLWVPPVLRGGVVWPPLLNVFPSWGCSPFSLSPLGPQSLVLLPFPLSPTGVSVLVLVLWPLQRRVARVIAWRSECGGGLYWGVALSVPPFLGTTCSPDAGAAGCWAWPGVASVVLRLGCGSSTCPACASGVVRLRGLCPGAVMSHGGLAVSLAWRADLC